MCLTETLNAFTQLIESWWKSDRIRVSPFEGGLWSLKEGSLITLGSRDIRICDQRIVSESPIVKRYGCVDEGDGERGEMLVTGNHLGKVLSLRWTTTEGSVEYPPEDVLIWC
ncbi:hypothetical protein SH668x_002423 [Planctomicrobium sp. SH668]|uniref:hypothetical protein n=1 Tax=Planctomicrobium sp. SH668 TaxID=3448126 RepID=UPI003F5C720A